MLSIRSVKPPVNEQFFDLHISKTGLCDDAMRLAKRSHCHRQQEQQQEQEQHEQAQQQQEQRQQKQQQQYQ